MTSDTSEERKKIDVSKLKAMTGKCSVAGELLDELRAGKRDVTDLVAVMALAFEKIHGQTRKSKPDIEEIDNDAHVGAITSVILLEYLVEAEANV